MSELPKGWVSTTLGSLGTWTSGGTPSRSIPSYYGDGIPWVKTGDLQDGPLLSVPETITEEGLRNSSAKRLPKGTLLVAMYGATIGKLGILTFEAATNQACAALLPHGRTADFIPFVFHFLHAEREELRRIGQGGAQPNISQGILKDYPIGLPPINEQRRIVAKLESLQARSRRAREALDAVPPLLEKLRQSILAAAFRGDLTKDWRAKNKNIEPATELLKRIRIERRHKWEQAELAKLKAKGKTPTDDKWKAKYKEPEPVNTEGLPVLPEGWCWARWEEVGFCQNGRAFPSAEYSKSGTKLLRPGNLNVSGNLDWTAENTRWMPSTWAAEFPEFLVGPDELLINLTAQSLKDEFLGRVCLSGPGEKCLLNQRLARLLPLTFPPKYWLQFFKSPAFRRYVDTLNTGSLIQHMFTSQVDAAVVPVMPLEEAAYLVRLVDSKLECVRAIATALAAQEVSHPALDRAILAKAFRGELVAQDPSDERAIAVQPSEPQLPPRHPYPSHAQRTTPGTTRSR